MREVGGGGGGTTSLTVLCFFLDCRVRKSKTNISLVPRVIARAHEGAEPEESPAGTGEKLSNSDFRKLFAKK